VLQLKVRVLKKWKKRELFLFVSTQYAVLIENMNECQVNKSIDNVTVNVVLSHFAG